MSTIQRITGTNSGLDVDALVKASMTTYQNKIDKETQNQKVLEYQQEQYKQIMSDASNFYDKYFDILKTGNLMSTNSYQSVSFKSGDDTKVTAKGFAGASVSDYKVTVTQLASKATASFRETELTGNDSYLYIKIKDSDEPIKVTVVNDGNGKINMESTVSNLNAALNTAGIDVSAKYSEFSGGIVLESGKMGSNISFNVGVGTKDQLPTIYKPGQGTNLHATISKTDGTTYTISDEENITTSNSKSIDKVTFSFKAVTTSASSTDKITLSGSTDVTDLKDKIVSFINDYNTLLSSINTKIYETRDKSYLPLTDAQKKEMTDDQIEKWETKAQTGLIRKDVDLERITSAMKSAMSTVISGSGLTLESIGIKPVANYAEKNGMFTIDEATLTKSLEENAGNIKDLFTRAASTNDKGGIFTQLAATLKSEFKSSTASLSKKAGIDGTSTQYNNTLTESIAKKKTLIEELNDKFSAKETALYNKYSALETALEKLNSQQASLSSMLGTS